MPRAMSPETVGPYYPPTTTDALIPFESVKVWDVIGEDKVLKGEYKVLAGKMYVISIFQFPSKG